MKHNKAHRITEMSRRLGSIMDQTAALQREIEMALEDEDFGKMATRGLNGARRFISAIEDLTKEFSDKLTAIASITEPKKISAEATARMNRLTILTAAAEDIIKAGYSISSTAVSKSTNVVAVMNNIAAEGFNTVLQIHKKNGEILGELEILDTADNEVFGLYPPKLADALDRAFGLINQANDYGTCFEN